MGSPADLVGELVQTYRGFVEYLVVGNVRLQPIVDAEAEVLLGGRELTLGVVREPDELLCVVG
jgi:hypothetical protein